MHVTAIIAAGGRGRRFGGERLKQLLSVGGREILERSVTAFLEHPDVNEVVVALPPDVVADPPDYLRSAEAFALRGQSEEAVELQGQSEEAVELQGQSEGFTIQASGKPLRIVAGGGRRQDSVANAFRATGAHSDIIVIHDAARPFASAGLIARTIAAAAEAGAALAAVQARDTVKRAVAPCVDDEVVVAETLDRTTIFLAQTPQAFRREVLQAALALGERDGIDATDEATLVERGGHEVRLVEGEASNIKITTPEDLPIAEAIARSAESLALHGEKEREGLSRAKPARTGRAGTGYDLHRLVPGRRLVLGGVTIPSDRGALGHSDADVVCHALTDAILGAVSLGDIGRHFPDSDPRWKDASSLDLLARAAALVAEQGFQVGNVDVTVILETPRIRDYVDAMRAAVAQAVGVEVARVSIKGKTNEGVDAVGRGEAIAAHAIALVRSSH